MIRTFLTFSFLGFAFVAIPTDVGAHGGGGGGGHGGGGGGHGGGGHAGGFGGHAGGYGGHVGGYGAHIGGYGGHVGGYAGHIGGYGGHIGGYGAGYYGGGVHVSPYGGGYSHAVTPFGGMPAHVGSVNSFRGVAGGNSFRSFGATNLGNHINVSNISTSARFRAAPNATRTFGNNGIVNVSSRNVIVNNSNRNNNLNRRPYYYPGFYPGFAAGFGLGFGIPYGAGYLSSYGFGYGYPWYGAGVGLGGYGGYGMSGYGGQSPVILADVPPPNLQAGVPQGGPEAGLRVVTVYDDTAAKQADLRAGDVIVGVGNTRVQTFDQLQKALANTTGDVDIIFLNGENGKLERLPVTPAEGKLGVYVVPIELKK